jgi:hypothetical protein
MTAPSAADMRVAPAATAAAMTAATAMADKLYHRGCSVAFFVKDVERREANVRDFFLTQEDLIAISVAGSG